MAARLAIAWVLLLCGASHAQVTAAVDPRVEFLSAVARTAGFEEYRMANATSPYSVKVDALFAPHARHPAFDRMREMRRKRGLSYDAVMSLALHISAPPECAERIALDQRPPRLDARLETESTRALLRDLRDLATAVDWAKFVAGERSMYETAAARLAAAANKTPVIPWFDRTLGVKAGASYQLIPGLLNGGGNYGVGVKFLDGTPEEIRPVIGCWSWDSQGLPAFGDQITPLVAHELCHSYTNAIVDRHEAAFKGVGEQLFASAAKQMERHAYGTWKTTMYETVVRALVVRFMKDTFGSDAGAKQAESDAKKGFAWVPGLAAAFDRYDADRTAYPTIEAFVPEMIAALKSEAAAIKAGPPAPRLVRSNPADGDENVRAGGATLRLEFDRPMSSESYSITGSLRDLPMDLVFDRVEEYGRVLTWRMKLEPGRTYSIGLNGGNFRGFKSKEGVPLPYAMIRFTTAAK